MYHFQICFIDSNSKNIGIFILKIKSVWLLNKYIVKHKNKQSNNIKKRTYSAYVFQFLRTFWFIPGFQSKEKFPGGNLFLLTMHPLTSKTAQSNAWPLLLVTWAVKSTEQWVIIIATLAGQSTIYVSNNLKS